ncbi:hypothetical protein CQW23_06088 [Capsicum baccatum]|uniref:Uncharacterized protein n=1 Tax=Capsicum baccatum TaxID=33114 RepID=A0A2G2X296_CAPBA|nr:hypothetical protein CQW23_06088 [Capsicum baccatum]
MKILGVEIQYMIRLVGFDPIDNDLSDDFILSVAKAKRSKVPKGSFIFSFMNESKGYYAQAISCYNEVLRIDLVNTDRLAKRGNAYIEIDRVDEAMFLHNIGARLLSTRASFAPMSAPQRHHFKPHLIPSRVPTPYPESQVEYQGITVIIIIGRELVLPHLLQWA